MRVFSNLAFSLDSKIADFRNPEKPLGTPYDRRLMKSIRQQSDVLFVGAETLRVSKKAVKVKNNNGRYIANAVISYSGKISPKLDFWKDDKVKRIFFTSKSGYQNALESSRDRALVFVLPERKKHLCLRSAVDQLKKMNFQNLLVEGGGVIIEQLIHLGLLDEMFLTLTPWFLGGATKNPSLFPHESLMKNWQKFKLLNSYQKSNEVYLHYKVMKKTRK